MAVLRISLTTASVGALLAIAAPTAAMAGQFQIASCQADRLNYSTIAFNGDFATRGMRIRAACNPEGPGLRGLLTANVIRPGTVQRGAVARVSITAAPGTHFTTLRWAGTARRRDCRYALQIWAEGPGVPTVPIKNVRANQHCPQPLRAQAAGYRSRTFTVAGATRIVQRVICIGANGHPRCSTRGLNYIRTFQAEVGVVDDQPPTASIALDTPLAEGAWVSGTQDLNYSAADNVGIRAARAVVGVQRGAAAVRPCALATPEGAFAAAVPCPNGLGRIAVETKSFPEGTQSLHVEAQDTAGNLGSSAPVTVRIDNTAPGPVAVAVDGGDNWRSANDFALAWVNPPEVDRAPIVMAAYKLCAAQAGSCTQGEQSGTGIARLPIQVPGPGAWTASMWRRDAAGNADPAAASVPVTLRYDPEPPQVAFEAPSASDPTLVAAQATDNVSGVADGVIEISRAGSNLWQSLATQKTGSRLLARIDDATLPAGPYVLRATAHDQAHNEASTSQRLDGQTMTLTLPLRAASALRAGIVDHRVVRRVVRRHGRRRTIRRRVLVLRPAAVVPLGSRVAVAGRLVNRDGQGIAGAQLQVLESSPVMPEQLVGAVRTDAAGRYRYTALAATSRTLRFAYAGSPLLLPTQTQVRIAVRAASSVHVSRRHVLNGQRVAFKGRVRSVPLPPGGKLVELQVLLSRRWQTFRTTRTDTRGRWTVRYRFARTRGVQTYRFRAELPPEAGYPFADGTSRTVSVHVRGL